MRVKPDASGSMSTVHTQGWHCLYWYYLDNIENPHYGKNTDISAMPSDVRQHHVTEA
jgi:hypothetical protein